MYWIALLLGFFGSLHCVGMCGPLALAIHSAKDQKGWAALGGSILYNSGRTLGYIVLGLLFGIVGSLAAFSGAQRIMSIVLGIVMILFFLFSTNPDQLIAKSPFLKKIYGRVTMTLGNLLKKSKRIPIFYLGIVNGFLPCGLVYLAIAGAISLGNIYGSIGFMLFFGLGTFPAMVVLAVGHQSVSQQLRVSLSKLYPYISLVLGIYLVYRGLMSKLPLELNFFEAIKNPILCH